MPKLTVDERRELTTLQNVLNSIEAFFKWLIYESSFIPEDLRRQFAEVFPRVSERLGNEIGDLGRVEDTDEPLWKRLDAAGLLGAALRLKLAIGQRVVEQASISTKPASTGIVGKLLQPVLKWINTFLGSLATAIPALELVKEYKDGVELVVENQRRGSPLPGRIFNF